MAKARKVFILTDVGHDQKRLEVGKLLVGTEERAAQDPAMLFFGRNALLRRPLFQTVNEIAFKVADDELSHAIIDSTVRSCRQDRFASVILNPLSRGGRE